MESETCELWQRDTKEKQSLQIEELADKVVPLLETMQTNLFKQNKERREVHTYKVDSRDEFKIKIKE